MLEQFYRSRRAELIGWCSVMTQDLVLAEDLVQEAFLRAMDHLTVLENLSETQQRAWFYRTIKNLYLDRVRHGRFESVYEDLPESIEGDRRTFPYAAGNGTGTTVSGQKTFERSIETFVRRK